MRRSGGAQILMQLNFSEERVKEMLAAPSLPIFSEQATVFLNELSMQLFKTGRLYSDVVTFAYWCRKSAVTSYKKQYEDARTRLGRGLAFHIAPSNVPVNFAFTMAAGLLAGNKNIVRLPSKQFAQVDIICDALEKTFEKYPDMKNYVYPVRYDKTSNCTEILSKCCNVRVIWGGDNTIREIRKAELPSRAFDITFADRYSVCVIQSDDYMKLENKKAAATDFYNDTYFSDQNACTSPRIVFWTGNAIPEAKKLFWEELQQLVDEKYTLEPVQAVGKLDAFCMVSMNKECSLNRSKNNLMRVELPSLDEDIMEYHYHSGFFFEYDLKDLKDMLVLAREKCQTISYIGNIGEEIQKAVAAAGVNGVDRVVPVGKTMDFSLIWDGYDLIRSMSRVVDLV